MTIELVITAAAERDLRRLDRPVAQRVAHALERYMAEERGDVRRLQASDE